MCDDICVCLQYSHGIIDVRSEREHPVQTRNFIGKDSEPRKDERLL